MCFNNLCVLADRHVQYAANVHMDLSMNAGNMLLSVCMYLCMSLHCSINQAIYGDIIWALYNRTALCEGIISVLFDILFFIKYIHYSMLAI